MFGRVEAEIMNVRGKEGRAKIFLYRTSNNVTFLMHAILSSV
jgi:hypothetical protein